MNRRGMATLGLALVTATVGAAAIRSVEQDPKPAAKNDPNGWQLPPDTEKTTNPLTVDPTVIATGKAIFKDKCQRCHGPGGVGDGPDADPDHRDDMDLTNTTRAEENSDGVMFYKVWNGRKKPKMPAFSKDLTKDQVWAVVTYAKTLRNAH
ncbi:MAG: c-type cytochrome [Acidobacteria bacterium]|nr:c-type cytochrome [Acidobacteriota bacterium]MCA1651682.1 c-type cytochrome [Acidobacteriota bacterium]